MKKLIITSLALGCAAMLPSCSTEESIAAEPTAISAESAFAKSFAKGFESLDIDFSKLFDYTTIQAASEETERAFTFITKDLQEELARRPDCDHAFLSFYLYKGKAGLNTVWFADAGRGVFTECMAFNTVGVRPYNYFIGDTSYYSQYSDFSRKHFKGLAAGKNEIGGELPGFITEKLGKEDGMAEFMVYVDKDSSRLYGFTEQL